ncbi:hypothetical protein B0H16DRAFT_1717002 [Mycena metata]|uniref:F-box domain-containing protein n=1 Tax=Mycena metata TaxID=1033252 RepID=A0AAD7NMN3_9AGAR|nr:hypothetical protein B0H16DRAFT_1717002 [Mycena metata]
MARGGRARRAQPAQELILKDSVRLPQELIDAIIDEFDVSLTDINNTSIFPDRNTLRSFSTQSGGWNQSPDERMRLFSKLLASRSHIAQYVRTLNFGYRCVRSRSLDHILLSLPNLNTVNLYPWRDSHSRNWEPTQEFPMHHRDSFVVVFSLSSLRSLSLQDHRFSNADALLSMLSNSAGLEELVLRNIDFVDLQVSDCPKNRPDTPRLVLRSLKLTAMSTTNVDALLNASIAVDISRLHSLYCDRYPASLLQAIPKVRDLTLYKYSSDTYPDEINVLSNALQNLSLNLDGLLSPSSFIRRVGNFSTAITLKRISITIRSNFGGALWQDIDSLLSAAPAAEEISFNLGRGFDPRDSDAIRVHLPLIDAKGILKITLLGRNLSAP